LNQGLTIFIQLNLPEEPLMKRFAHSWIALVCLIGASSLPGTAAAESVAVPAGQQADRSSVDIPQSGMKQSSVENHYGNPNSRRGPVGDPPITVWSYNGFTVYFEYDRVIHTVIDHRVAGQ